MRKLFVSLFVFIFLNVNSCRIPEPCSLKLGDTTLKSRDVQRLLDREELECVSNFIKGNYVEFANDLNLCVNTGYLSSNECANAIYKEMRESMKMLKAEVFCIEGLTVSTYV